MPSIEEYGEASNMTRADSSNISGTMSLYARRLTRICGKILEVDKCALIDYYMKEIRVPNPIEPSGASLAQWAH